MCLGRRNVRHFCKTTTSKIIAGNGRDQVPVFDVITIADITCILPLALNVSDTMCIGIASLNDLLQSIDQYLIFYIVYNVSF